MTTPTFTLILMLLGWIAVALALLWGLLRVARRRSATEESAPRAQQNPDEHLKVLINL